MSRSVSPSFWINKRVFITGHTGFKGGWLSLWLQSMGAQVKGYALEPTTKHSLFKVARVGAGMESVFGDIRNLAKLKASVKAFDPDIIFHMAAQPIVRQSYLNPVETYATNVMGTVHILEVARSLCNVRVIVNVTTDKCYENREWPWGYRENDPVGGRDPYSNSKSCSELVTTAYRSSFFNSADSAALASARAGNVIGGGDWSEDRLIPDILRSFESERPVLIRNPHAIRPWQHVLEALSGYLVLAERLYDDGAAFAEGWNFGPRDEDVQSVEWILNYLVGRWGHGATWSIDTDSQPYEAQSLKLDISKSKTKLNWSPKWTLALALDSIIDWQRAWLKGADVQQKTLDQINQYRITSHVNRL